MVDVVGKCSCSVGFEAALLSAGCCALHLKLLLVCAL